MPSRRHPAPIPLPPIGLLWREIAALADWRRFALASVGSHRHARAVPASVMVIPGFLTGDGATAALRAGLADGGYGSLGWGMGVNLGASAARLSQLADTVSRHTDTAGAPIALVGWSLGGLYAREVAKLVPERVARVITLGSPFSGDPRANRVWRLYELINRHPVDILPIAGDLARKPPVPTIAIWSANDGIVAPACSRGKAHEVDHHVEVRCSHIGFTYERDAVDAVLDALQYRL
jgi:pimeloyl-ACP methyl ester carboxylesterase